MVAVPLESIQPRTRSRSALDAADLTLSQSFEECRKLHRAHGTTYYWATMALPKVSRPFVHALYGLCRYADEIVDAFDDATPSQRSASLNRLRHELRLGLREGDSDHHVLKAVVFTARAFDLPTSAFERFFDAMRSDLHVATYRNYGELERYMDGSAAVIGELMLPILDPSDFDAAFVGARDLGIAFQLTNFLRDVGEDLDRGRVYFPQDELEEFGVDIEQRRVDSAWVAFCDFQIERMHELYRSADGAMTYLPPSSVGSIRAARVLYSEILEHVIANGYDVFSQRARVPLGRKLRIAGGEWLVARRTG